MRGDARIMPAADICITAGRPSPLASILIVTFPLSLVSLHTTRISGVGRRMRRLEKVGLLAQGWWGVGGGAGTAEADLIIRHSTIPPPAQPASHYLAS